jgi:hypothetical protein
MALLVPNVGETELLSRMLNKSTTGDVKIHLYSDDVTPAEGDTVSSYTLITDPAAISLTGSNWSVTDGTASYAQQTFTFSGSATAYGYVVTDAAGTTLLWSERFTDGPYTIPAGGGTIKITPTISLD